MKANYPLDINLPVAYRYMAPSVHTYFFVGSQLKIYQRLYRLYTVHA